MAGSDERARARGDRSRAARGAARPATSRRTREPQLQRARSRAGSVVAATTGFLGVSTTRRAAILAIVVCALALTVSVPLRNYVSQRQELSAIADQQRALAAQVDDLNRQRAELSDPDAVAAEARSRLGYVRPGEVPYVVQLPAPPPPDPYAAESGAPWFQRLWRDVSEGPPAPVSSTQ